MSKRAQETTYSAFRDFLLDNAELVRNMLAHSTSMLLLSVSKEANLPESSIAAVGDHCIEIVQGLNMKSPVRSEMVSYLSNVNKFKNLLAQRVKEQKEGNEIVVELVIDASCRAVANVLVGSAPAVIELGNALSHFYFTICQTATSDDSRDVSTMSSSGSYSLKIQGSFYSYSIDETLNKRLKTLYELNFMNQSQGSDYLNMPIDRKAAHEVMHKRVAVYDAAKYRSSQYFNVKRNSKKEDTKRILMNALQTNVLFSSYTQFERRKIVDAFEKIEVMSGDVVIRQGERGDHFYVVESGRLQLYIENADGEQILSPNKIESGASFGEIALLYDIPRTATVAAVENSVLWRVDRHTYRYVVSSTERASMEETMAFLCEVQIKGKKFKDMLNTNDLNLLVTAVEVEDFAKGEIIIRQDQPGDYFYIIKCGDIAVCKVDKIPGYDTPIQKALASNGSIDTAESSEIKPSDGTVSLDVELSRLGLGTKIALLHPGDYFGERALLGEDVRTASCVALTDVTCLSLSRDVFVKLVGPWHDLELDNAPSQPSDMFRRVDSLQEIDDGNSVSNHINTVDTGRSQSTDAKRSSLFSTDDSGKQILDLIPSSSSSTAVTNDMGNGPTTPVRSNDNSRPNSRNMENENASALAHFVFSGSTTARSRTSSDFQSDFENACCYGIRSLSQIDQLFTLGTGAFGRVRLAKCAHTGKFVVVKIQGKKAIQEQSMEEAITNEIILMRNIRSHFVAKLYSAFQDTEAVYMIMEFLPCGDFFAYLQTQGKTMQEDKARFYSANVVAGLDALHSQGIAYRDLKPENLVMDAKGYIKLVDLGLAKKIVSGKTWTLCGTPDYIAPEVIMNKGHDKAVDYWALGVLIYEMVGGYPPFYDENPMKVYQLICSGKYNKENPNFSANLLDIIQNLLQKNPSKRIGNSKSGVADICKHKWFGAFDWKGLLRGTLPPVFVPSFDAANPAQPKIENDLIQLMEPSSWIADLGDC